MKLRILYLLTLISVILSCKYEKENNLENARTTKINRKGIALSSSKLVDSLNNNIKDLGVIKYNSDTVFSFFIKSTDTIPLTIYKVETGCVCTSIETKVPLTIKYNEIAAIKVRYNTKIKGAFLQDVLVFNNSQVNPILLQIKGNVQ